MYRLLSLVVLSTLLLLPSTSYAIGGCGNGAYVMIPFGMNANGIEVRGDPVFRNVRSWVHNRRERRRERGGILSLGLLRCN